MLIVLAAYLISYQLLPAQELIKQSEQLVQVEPEIFEPGIISLPSRAEFGAVFNRAGTECFIGVDVDGKAEIHSLRNEQDKWTESTPILIDDRYSFNDPFLSNDESRLYFISNMPSDEQDTLLDHDIWYVERIEKAWSKPINAGPAINSLAEEYYISFTKDGSMYFASNSQAEEGRARDLDIYKSPYIEGKFQSARKLAPSINTAYYEADVFVDPEENYLIFCSIRREGLGRGDLYVSFKDETGVWSEAKNLGMPINTEHHELCPYVSHDGRFLYYTSNQDIYRVSMDLVFSVK